MVKEHSIADHHIDALRLQALYLIGITLFLSAIFIEPFREWMGFGWWFLLVVFVIQRIAGQYGTLINHRFYAHSYFSVPRWLELLIVALCPLFLQGYHTGYVLIHLTHHKYSDQEGDPHPPENNYGRTRFTALLFPFMHRSGALEWPEWKLIINHMKRPGQKILTQHYWKFVIAIGLIISLINYKLILLWIMGTQVAIFAAAVLNTYGHNPPNSKWYFWRYNHPTEGLQNHQAVDLPGWWFGRGEQYHGTHHCFPQRWNFHPNADKGFIDHNAKIINLLVNKGLAKVRTPY